MPTIKSHSWRPDKSAESHGPRRCDTVLLIVKAIGAEAENSDRFVEQALPAAQNLAQLCERAREAGVPVIFAGGATDVPSFNALVKDRMADGVRGAAIARLLEPRGDDYFVPISDPAGLPSPALDFLLEDLGVRGLIIAGNAAEICTWLGSDAAHLRGYDLYVPADCLLSAAAEDNLLALYFMRNTLDADLTPSDEIDFTPPG